VSEGGPEHFGIEIVDGVEGLDPAVLAQVVK